MTTKIILKKSSVASNAPNTGDLDYGELAINFADGRLYFKNSSNIIKNFIDSDLISSVIDAKLVAAGVGDSAATITLIQNTVDSDYIAAREADNLAVVMAIALG